MRYRQLISEEPQSPIVYNTQGHQLTEMYYQMSGQLGVLIYNIPQIEVTDVSLYREFYNLLNHRASIDDQMTFLLDLDKTKVYPTSKKSQNQVREYELVRSIETIAYGTTFDPIRRKMTLIDNISDQLLINLAKSHITQTWMAVLYPIDYKFPPNITSNISHSTFQVLAIPRKRIINYSVQSAVARAVMATHNRNFQLIVLASAIYYYIAYKCQNFVKLVSDMVTQDPSLKSYFTSPLNVLKGDHQNKLIFDTVKEYFKQFSGKVMSDAEQMALVSKDGMKIEELYKHDIYPSNEVKHRALVASGGQAIDIMIKYEDADQELKDAAETIKQFHNAHN